MSCVVTERVTGTYGSKVWNCDTHITGILLRNIYSDLAVLEKP